MEAQQKSGDPFQCQEAMQPCAELIMIWTVGMNGVCHEDHYGTLIGEGGYVAILTQVSRKWERGNGNEDMGMRK